MLMEMAPLEAVFSMVAVLLAVALVAVSLAEAVPQDNFLSNICFTQEVFSMEYRIRFIISIVIVAVIVLFISFFSSRNGLIDLRENVEMQQSQIETTLQRRSDLIPNLVETVKGYTAHEKRSIYFYC